MKSKEKKYQRDYMRRYREKQKGTEFRPIVYALADPKERAKLKAICESLEGHNVLESRTYYGAGCDPTLMSEVAELLTAF